MLNKYNFELTLERVAEKFYFNGASQHGKVRGGNSADNEAYFKNVSSDLIEKLNCQQILIKKGACPDSGLFGEFNYKHEEEIDWKAVLSKKLVVLEVDGVSREKRYIEVSVDDIPELKVPVVKKPKIVLNLNKVGLYGEIFGVEYKASKSKTLNSINVAPFNSTCPSLHKTVEIAGVRLFHNFDSKYSTEINGIEVNVCEIKLEVNFTVYYLIVNDYPSGQISEIKKIFICDGGFFAPGVSESKAKELSEEKKPEEIGVEYELYRVGLRYRPFFGSKTIKANGYGLYTSWDPKIPKEEEEEKQRKLLLDEVEKVQQSFSEVLENIDAEEVVEGNEEMPDNVIYLNLRDDRIRKRVGRKKAA